MKQYILTLALILTSCGAGMLDYHTQLGENLFFSSDGSRRVIFIGERFKDGLSIDQVLIPPKIIQYIKTTTIYLLSRKFIKSCLFLIIRRIYFIL